MFLRLYLFLSIFIISGLNTAFCADQSKEQYFGTIRIIDQSADMYRQYYPFHPGDFFTPKKHVHGIEKIRQTLSDHGYLSAQVIDVITPREESNEVDVAISLEKGQRYKIANVSIQGQESYPALLSALTHQVSKKLLNIWYQAKRISEVAAQLNKQLLYDGFCQPKVTPSLTVNKRSGTVSLLLTIEFGKRTQYIFHGNQFFTDEQIFQTIFAGQSFWLLPASVLQQEIEAAYQQKGFWGIAIKAVEKGGATHFYINEGDRARIKKVIINGAKGYSSQELAAQHFSYLFKGRFFDEALLDEAIEKMSIFYARNGFWDMVVLDTTYRKRTNNFYELIVTIDEGPQRFLSQARIWDFPKLSKTWPFRIEKKSIPFNKALLYDQYYWLNNYFADHGYTIIKSDPVIDEISSNDFRVTWHLEREKEQIIFGQTSIRKTGKLPIARIERELTFQSSTPWDAKKLDATIARLRDLQIFKTVEYAIASSDNKKRDVIITIEEDDPFEVRARFGLQQVSKNKSFDTGTSFKAGGSLVWKNPLNRAGQFLIDGDITRFDRNFLGQYSLPWIFGRRIATDFRVYSSRQNNPPFVEADSKLYQSRIDGLGANFERNYGVLDWGMSFGFEWQGVFKGAEIDCNIADALDFDAALLDRRLLYFYCSPHCAIRWLDDELDPHKGFITSVFIKGMLNNDDKERLSFAKILVEQSFFMPIVDPVVLAVRFRFGHITSQEFQCILPSERFFLGGPNTVRGYEPDFLPPLGVCMKEEICIPQGGKTMVNANFELRFPLYKWVHGVIFNDLGFLCKDDCFPDKPLGATGLGLRLKSPLGIVRFDVGWKWNPSSLELRRTGQFIDQTPLAWYLTIGHAF